MIQQICRVSGFCHQCRHWHHADRAIELAETRPEDFRGQCRKNPPDNSGWPKVYGGDWCSELAWMTVDFPSPMGSELNELELQRALKDHAKQKIEELEAELTAAYGKLHALEAKAVSVCSLFFGVDEGQMESISDALENLNEHLNRL